MLPLLQLRTDSYRSGATGFFPANSKLSKGNGTSSRVLLAGNTPSFLSQTNPIPFSLLLAFPVHPEVVVSQTIECPFIFDIF